MANKFLKYASYTHIFYDLEGRVKMDKQKVKYQWNKRGHKWVKDPSERTCSRETKPSSFITSTTCMVLSEKASVRCSPHPSLLSFTWKLVTASHHEGGHPLGLLYNYQSSPFSSSSLKQQC